MLAHRVAVTALFVVVAVGGYYGAGTLNKKTTATIYTLGTVEKGTLITSISGSGQVSASDQLDVHPKISGDVIKTYVVPGQQIKTGDVLVAIDSRDARKAVRDAENALVATKLSLEKIQNPADELTVVQTENALASAERAEVQSQQNLAQLKASTAQQIVSAYENGYSSASGAFLDMPNHMKDLKDLRGTEAAPDTNIAAFGHILGENSPLITNWVRDHDVALSKFNEDFTYFKTVSRDASDATRYTLINRTLITETAVAKALESAHAMLDAVVNTSYSLYTISATVNTLRPKITSDIAQINSDIGSTQSAKDTIDGITRDTPINIKKNEDAITAAQESIREKIASLAKLKSGADTLDLRTQQLSVQQRQDALSDALQKLNDYVIVAPFDGTVATFALKRGDVVSSSTNVATLITAQRFADVTLNEVDAVKIKTGDKVTLTFDAIDGLDITGKIADVSLLGTVSQGVVTYVARVQFDTQDERVRPGMSVRAAILTDVRTDVLLVPGSAVKTSQANGTYVLMFDTQTSSGKKTITTTTPPMPHAIEVGASNDTQTEITNGLKEGDSIVTKSASVTAATSSSTARPTTSIGIPGLGGGGGGGFRAGGVRGD